MANVPVNYLQQVQTFQISSLALLQNLNCFVGTANTEYNEFNKMPANLGSTVTFDRPPRFVAQDGLVVNFQPASQLVQALTVNRQKNASYAFTSQQLIFNAQDYIRKFGRSAMTELSAAIEIDVAKNAESQPYRFFGDGVTPLGSFTQVSTMLALFREFGATTGGDDMVYLSNMQIPQIIGSGLNQFVPGRNEGIASSWMIGDYDSAKFYRSNLLATHISGSTGNNGNTLTVISTNDPTGANITQITVSGASVVSDINAVKLYDSFQFKDNVSGQPNMRFLTYNGHNPCDVPVQIQATANAASDGSGDIVINITPALCAQQGNASQNIAFNIVAGMQLLTYPSHRCGMIVGGRALYLAMPELPDMMPYPTSNEADPVTKTSMRLYYGGIPNTGQVGYVNDVIWGSTAVPDYCMKIMIPLLSQ